MNMEPAQLVSAVGPQPRKYRTQRHRKGQLLPLHEPNSNPTSFLVFFRNDMSKTFRHFLLFSGLMHCAVLVAGPYFVIYLLQDLHLAHWQYGI